MRSEQKSYRLRSAMHTDVRIEKKRVQLLQVAAWNPPVYIIANLLIPQQERQKTQQQSTTKQTATPPENDI